MSTKRNDPTKPYNFVIQLLMERQLVAQRFSTHDENQNHKMLKKNCINQSIPGNYFDDLNDFGLGVISALACRQMTYNKLVYIDSTA